MSTRVVVKQKAINTVFHLEDVEAPPTSNNISHTLSELDPQEREKEKRCELVEELESIKLDDQHLELVIQIGSQLPGCLRDQLISFLREHNDVFAWSHEDMPGIDLSIIVHRLNVDHGHKPSFKRAESSTPNDTWP